VEELQERAQWVGPGAPGQSRSHERILLMTWQGP
jgi:hypothetical protein